MRWSASTRSRNGRAAPCSWRPTPITARSKYDEAISDASVSSRCIPGSSSAPYAYYLIALSHYEQIYDVGRDQSTTQQAMAGAGAGGAPLPDTPYAQDARLKLDMTRDHLAGKEMSVGRWYLRNGYYLAAINRFQTVIREYETTSHTPEALHRLVEAYVSAGRGRRGPSGRLGAGL
jgi:outer membrane protein assembly factor BamD